MTPQVAHEWLLLIPVAVSVALCVVNQIRNHLRGK
jgi:hypothetical protein